MSGDGLDVAAVVVDFHAGEALADCVRSLRSNGVVDIVVVENGERASSAAALEGLSVDLVVPGVNLGYGGGVNRGAAHAPRRRYLLISNPDVVVHDGAVEALVRTADAHTEVGIVGPRIVSSDGTIYPSQRSFPNMWLAGAHALVEPIWPANPATRRYRSRRDERPVDWVSGAFMLIPREVFERVGGFDERYFMFAEDMDLCWRVRELGYEVSACDDAVVTHIEGLSRARDPRPMLIAHHRSALRFEWQTSRGLRRLLVPLATLVLGLRLLVVLMRPGTSLGDGS